MPSIKVSRIIVGMSQRVYMFAKAQALNLTAKQVVCGFIPCRPCLLRKLNRTSSPEASLKTSLQVTLNDVQRQNARWHFALSSVLRSHLRA
jgi:hypothetical protein